MVRDLISEVNVMTGFLATVLCLVGAAVYYYLDSQANALPEAAQARLLNPANVILRPELLNERGRRSRLRFFAFFALALGTFLVGLFGLEFVLRR